VIKPFRGWRYDERKTKPLSLVVAPPYDVILPNACSKYFSRHPKNFINLSLGKQGTEKNLAEGNYSKAAQVLKQWLEDGTLMQESRKSFYVYEETFEVAGKKLNRTGFIALLNLENSDGNVLKHEKTLPKPLEDRLLLLRATKADLEPIFLLFEDSELEVESILKKAKESKPVLELVDEMGVRHKMWLLQGERCTKIARLLEGQNLLIADGHHRYSTALTFMKESKSPGFKFKMVYLLGTGSKGLLILPTHRGLLQVGNKSSFLKQIEKFFELEEKSKVEVFKLLEKAEVNCFAMLFQKKYFFCSEKKQGLVKKELESRKLPEVLQELPTTVLHSIVLEACLKENPKNIVFEKSVQKLVKGVEAGRLEAAFFLKATTLKQFEAVSKANQLMPPKSTYFYPKPLSGLVFYKPK